MSVSDMINLIAQKYNFNTYLEIGVANGETFLNVKIRHKIAVDPYFRFDVTRYKSPSAYFFEMTSDAFFADFPNFLSTLPYGIRSETDFLFDVVFIDGFHSFDQSYRDFKKVLPYCHKDTVIIIDDTIPSDPWSSIPNQKKSYFYRKLAGISGTQWHGDVFKTIFAIHDEYPEYSYATQISNGNPLTFVWRTSNISSRKRIFDNSISCISTMSYFDMLDYSYVLVPVNYDDAITMIGMEIDVEEYKNKVDMKKIANYCQIQMTSER